MVKNRKLGESPLEDSPDDPRKTQACGASGCRLCPLLMDLNVNIEINGINLLLDNKLTCKTKSCVYVATCQICVTSNSYFGQTLTAVNTRFNGHRSKFVPDNIEICEKSALSQHCVETHIDEISLDNFRIGIVKACTPNTLDREESRYINKFRTNIWGLNRMKVIK